MLDIHAFILRPTVEVPDVAVVGGEVSDGEALRLRAGMDPAAWLCTLRIEIGEGKGDLVRVLLVAGDALDVQLVRALGEEAVGAFVVRVDPRASHTCLHLLHHIRAAGTCDGIHLRPSVDPTTGTRAFHRACCCSQEGEDNARSHDSRPRDAIASDGVCCGTCEHLSRSCQVAPMCKAT